MVEPTSIDVIAYHEAGHAVVALYYARNVIGISVGQPRPEESHVYHDPPRPVGNVRIDPDNLTAVWPLAVEDAFIECRILLGGSVAQAMHEGRSVREIDLGQDGEDFLGVLKYLEDTRCAVPALQKVADLSYKQGTLERLLLETFAVLGQRWVTVERLAGELIKRRKLTGEDVVSIVYPDDTGKDVAKGRCCWHCKYYIRSKELFILDGLIEEVCVIDRKKNVYASRHRSYPGDKHTKPNDFCDRFEMS